MWEGYNRNRATRRGIQINECIRTIFVIRGKQKGETKDLDTGFCPDLFYEYVSVHGFSDDLANLAAVRGEAWRQ